ncbi:MAG: hypothetical protein RIT28_1518, partial [Pseudomonadota bacterium]
MLTLLASLTVAYAAEPAVDTPAAEPVVGAPAPE